jgi:TRAP-type uncharacterized transport system substrate-binding protein
MTTRRPKIRPHHVVWTGARSLAPLLAPFLVSAAFIFCYCAANIQRGLGCLMESRLVLASGPMTQRELGSHGRRIFYQYELGEQISRLILRNCGQRPRWWSLDFWVNPDAQNRIRVENRPSAGTRDSIVRLFKRESEPDHADLAILQDGLIVEGELQKLNEAEPDRIQALVHLYKSALCIFARKDLPYRVLTEMRGRRPQAYLGMRGSGGRYLTERVLRRFLVDCEDIQPDWSPHRVARVMTSNDKECSPFEVAFVLDKLDSGVIRSFVESGRYNLVSIDTVDDLFREDELFRVSTTMRPIRLARGSLSEQNTIPTESVTTIETQTILACSSDLADWDAYQIARTLTEHFKEFGLSSDPSVPVSHSDPGSTFDYPIHDGAARYYRHGVANETFPYPVLVVAIGASVALIMYWNTLALKRRADRMTEQIDEILHRRDGDPQSALSELGQLKLRAVLRYKNGRLNKEGYERICEYILITKNYLEVPRGEIANDAVEDNRE